MSPSGVTTLFTLLEARFSQRAYCNDVKLFINPHGAGKGLKIDEVHGYEYGCGYDDRGISGSMKETSTTKYFTLLGSYSGSQAKILYFYIDKLTNTGAGTWTYIGPAFFIYFLW